jgi:hypothetical protein
MSKSHVSLIFAAAALLLTNFPAPAQKLPWHGRQAEVLPEAKRVMLLPPDVHVDQWTTTSGRELSGTSDYVRRTICGTLDQVFEEKKVDVSEYPLCLGEGELTVERADAIMAVIKRFRELVTAWTKPRRQADLLDTFHLGDELETIKKFEVDALVVVCADGNLKSKGEKAMGALGGGAPAESILIRIGVIRPRNGELLFFTEKGVGGDFLKHEDKLEGAIDKAVRSAFEPPPAPKEPAH